MFDSYGMGVGVNYCVRDGRKHFKFNLLLIPSWISFRSIVLMHVSHLTRLVLTALVFLDSCSGITQTWDELSKLLSSLFEPSSATYWLKRISVPISRFIKPNFLFHSEWLRLGREVSRIRQQQNLVLLCESNKKSLTFSHKDEKERRLVGGGAVECRTFSWDVGIPQIAIWNDLRDSILASVWVDSSVQPQILVLKPSSHV
jgi:hypothetical protein